MANETTMTLARVNELDDRYGPGRSRMNVGTKTELLRVVQELIGEMRRQFKAKAAAAQTTPATIAADVETFIAAWNTNCAEYLGDVVAQAGYEPAVPHLTTAHLRTLLDDRAAAMAELDELRTFLADPLESLQDLTEFEIGAMHATDGRPVYVRVDHVPCQTIVFGLPDDADHLDVDDLLERIATHQCDQAVEPRDIRQAISVQTDDGVVTAAIHGPQLLDHEGQEAMADIVRAVIRKQRQEREDEARERDNETRAIANLLFEAGKTSFRGFDNVGLVLTMTEVQMRFADRIADVQQRDAAKEATSDG